MISQKKQNDIMRKSLVYGAFQEATSATVVTKLILDTIADTTGKHTQKHIRHAKQRIYAFL